MTITDSPRERLLAGTGFVERRVEAAGIDTAVLESGNGPGIVLLHGPGEFALGWSEVITELVATYRVVAPDLPGHGESGASDDIDVARLLSWLDGVIAATCSASPIVVGRTLGGAIAARYCAEHADRVDQLVLVDTLGLSTFAPAPSFAEALEQYFADPTTNTFDGLMQYCAYDLDGVRQRLGDRYAALAEYAVGRLRAGTTLATVGALVAQFGAEMPRTVLARITVPTALIWGRHDLATPLSVAERASRTFGWPLYIVEDAADEPSLDQPEAFVATLRRAIEQGAAD
jgi:pimeloyl-ACP methyl ester carboxylesterase